MKKVFLFLFILILANTSKILASPIIDLDAIKHIESRGIADAVSPKGAIGLYQITPIALKDFNRMTGKKYKKDDLYLIWVNHEIARWLLTKRIPQLLKAKKKSITVENLLTAYNAGHTYVGKRLPKETQNYIRKYRKAVQS